MIVGQNIVRSDWTGFDRRHETSKSSGANLVVSDRAAWTQRSLHSPVPASAGHVRFKLPYRYDFDLASRHGRKVRVQAVKADLAILHANGAPIAAVPGALPGRDADGDRRQDMSRASGRSRSTSCRKGMSSTYGQAVEGFGMEVAENLLFQRPRGCQFNSSQSPILLSHSCQNDFSTARGPRSEPNWFTVSQPNGVYQPESG